MKIDFKPFDRILIKGKDKDHFWYCAIFSHESDIFVHTVGEKSYTKESYFFLPYEGNANLVGTSDMPCEEVELKDGDLVAVADDIEDIVRGYASIRRFSAIISNALYCKDNAHKNSREDTAWTYCIPFSKFNPNDMEETKKHVLCVKNGKLVKARV